MGDEEIRQFLERYGQALSAGDTPAIVECWAVPALILADEGARVVTDAGEIATFFAQVVAWYRAQGIMATRPELERVDRLSEKLAAVDVRWPSFDAAGNEQSSERSHYLLQRGEDEQIRFRVTLTRTM
jgi:hypothetical protein